MKQFILTALAVPALLTAQSEWNSPGTMERVFLGMSARMLPVEDSLLTSYSARAEGHIYFYLDREVGEPVPMMVDQVALDVHWQYPDQERQVITAMRRERLLPVRDFRYYSDRVSLVVDGYGDVIRIGEGRDVAAVAHPLAPGAEAVYRYRSVDSLSIRPFNGDEIDVVAIQFEPMDSGRDAAVGVVYLDAEDGAIVRLEFGFTPSSYTDRRVDVITVELEYALWEERFWLPWRQRLTVKRESPEFDIPFASVIRSVLEVSSYELNPSLDDEVFDGPPLVYPDVRQFSGDSSRFTSGLLDRLDSEGLTPPLEPIDFEAEIGAFVESQTGSGLPATRLGIRSISSLLRFNRGEGLFVGGGFSQRLSPFVINLGGGYRVEAGSAELTARSFTRIGRGVVGFEWSFRDLREIGPVPGAAGAVNSLGAAILARDYLDPYYRSGLELNARLADGDKRFSVRLGLHDETPFGAGLTEGLFGATFRPLRSISSGRRFGLGAEFSATLPKLSSFRVRSTLTAQFSRFEDENSARLSARFQGRRWFDLFSRVLELDAFGVVLTGDSPVQDLVTLGGRNTLPGYGYREFAGTRLIFVKLGGVQDIYGKKLGLRAALSAGSVWGNPGAVPRDWFAGPTGGLRFSASLGLSMMLDLARVEVGRGLRGGGWELMLSASPAIGGLL